MADYSQRRFRVVSKAKWYFPAPSSGPGLQMSTVTRAAGYRGLEMALGGAQNVGLPPTTTLIDYTYGIVQNDSSLSLLLSSCISDKIHGIIPNASQCQAKTSSRIHGSSNKTQAIINHDFQLSQPRLQPLIFILQNPHHIPSL